MPHLVIIASATFEKARAICKASDKRSDGHQRKTVHGKQLLTGLLYCGECGKKFASHYKSAMHTFKNGSAWKWEQHSYRCTSYFIPFERMNGGWHQTLHRVDQIDKLVIDDAKSFVKQSDREKLLKNSETSTGEELKIATEKAAKIKRELARAEREHAKLEEAVVKSLMGDSEYPPAFLNKLLTDKVKELTDLIAEGKAADAEREELQARFDSQKEFAENLDTWEAHFEQADSVQKKAMILNIIDRITVNPSRLIVIYKLETRRMGRLQTIEMPDWLTIPTIDGMPDNQPPYPPQNSGDGGNPAQYSAISPNTAHSHTASGVKG
jgi:hypothetical protein